MDQVIRLDPKDDILRLHSKVEWSDGRRVILVVPRGCKALDSEHELRLLRRWADSSDVMVGLVTSDINVREMASEIGLPIFSSIDKAQRTQWAWPRNGTGVITSPDLLEDEPIVPKQPLLDRMGLAGAQLVITAVIFVGASTILGIAAFLLVPSARITIVPASVVLKDTREVILDPSVTTLDQVNGILPATTIRREISGTASVATVKTNTAPADHATGNVIFTNVAGTQATIPLGTLVETSSGVTVRFSTTVTATLAANYNARVNVPVRAIEAGPIGNVKALQINFIEGPLSAVARVINPAGTGGGTIKQVHVVSFDDKARLREKLADDLRQAAIAKMQNQAGDGAFIPPVSVAVLILNESFDHLVDDPTDSLSLHVEAVGQGIAVDRSDLQQFAQSILKSKVPDGYSILPGTLQVDADTNARMEGNSVIFSLRSSLVTTPIVRDADLLKGLTGKRVGEAQEILAQRVKLAQPPVVELTPSWWPRLPFFSFRIEPFVKTPNAAP